VHWVSSLVSEFSACFAKPDEAIGFSCDPPSAVAKLDTAFALSEYFGPSECHPDISPCVYGIKELAIEAENTRRKN
jgi:hypothetical protein